MVKYTPELMDDQQALLLTQTLKELLENKSEIVWPAAYDARRRGKPIELADTEIVVLPLERIGAPPGASGARVFIAYYSHLTSLGANRSLVSPPLAVKVGKADALRAELEAKENWPSLDEGARQMFAFPFHLDDSDPDNAVLIAPFRSHFSDSEHGARNRVQLGDLWRLLTDPKEVLERKLPNYDVVAGSIGDTLDAMMAVHRDNMASVPRSSEVYGPMYQWYLRSTCSSIGKAERSHIPTSLFGTEATVRAFGRSWPNPVRTVAKIVDKKLKAELAVGPVHGDLHSKNVVFDKNEQVRIIDFGWARGGAHVVVDYLLLDINMRATTLPSQFSERDVLSFCEYINPSQSVAALPDHVKSRATLIRDEIWRRASERVVRDWFYEYIIPMMMVNYGLLVHLDHSRNQVAMVAQLLSLTQEIERSGVL